jgi:hypothetical protein
MPFRGSRIMLGHAGQAHKYTLLGQGNQRPAAPVFNKKQATLVMMVIGLAVFAGFVLTGLLGTPSSCSNSSNKSCDTVQHGYQCDNSRSHFWGAYLCLYRYTPRVC